MMYLDISNGAITNIENPRTMDEMRRHGLEEFPSYGMPFKKGRHGEVGDEAHGRPNSFSLKYYIYCIVLYKRGTRASTEFIEKYPPVKKLWEAMQPDSMEYNTTKSIEPDSLVRDLRAFFGHLAAQWKATAERGNLEMNEMVLTIPSGTEDTISLIFLS